MYSCEGSLFGIWKYYALSIFPPSLINSGILISHSVLFQKQNPPSQPKCAPSCLGGSTCRATQSANVDKCGFHADSKRENPGDVILFRLNWECLVGLYALLSPQRALQNSNVNHLSHKFPINNPTAISSL